MRYLTQPAFLAVGILAIVAASALVRADGESKAPVGGNDGLRCERINGGELKDLKEKLTEYCNTNKPFSIAGTNNSLNSGYTYCCNKK